MYNIPSFPHNQDQGKIMENKEQVPYIQPVTGIDQLMPISFTLPPDVVLKTNCFVLGDEGDKKIIVDPSPNDENEYKKLVNTLKGFGYTYTGIFITHHHGDHHQGAPGLARDFSIPLVMSEDSFRRILKKRGESYFEKVEIRFAREGDMLTRWKGKKVEVYEIPGHDEGQLGLAPGSMEWFLVGDLVEGSGTGPGTKAGTVVIGGDEGDMKKYFQTLERIIRLAPKILLPSHGMALESVVPLEKTLKHRKYREKQVLRLYEKGKTPQQMVEKIYKNVDKRLWPLALENINAHLKKINDE
jgi:glyoxylase-like metal-dependent hydrolase (beta-lactamase superfamily II)